MAFVCAITALMLAALVGCSERSSSLGKGGGATGGRGAVEAGTRDGSNGSSDNGGTAGGHPEATTGGLDGGATGGGDGGVSGGKGGAPSLVGDASASTDGGANGDGGGPTPTPKLPATNEPCPPFTNGGVVDIKRADGVSVPVTIYVDANAKSKPAPGGPLIVYWHGTGSSPSEVTMGFSTSSVDNIAKVTALGGVVAAPAATTCNGCTNTDVQVWFEEDDVVMDRIVACAIQNAQIDVTHIHILGSGAGALHTTHLAQARSDYIASFISYSGGLALPTTDQNPANRVAGILSYGDPSTSLIIDINAASKSWYSQFQPMGWYAMMCHRPGGRGVDPEIAPLAFEFFQAHPFAVSPEPYAHAIPSGYPAYCSNTPD